MREVCRSRHPKRNMVFPLVLTKVFRAHDVSFANEEKVLSGVSDVVDPNTMLSLGYTWDEASGRWVDPQAGVPFGMQKTIVRQGLRGSHDEALLEEAELDARDVGGGPSTSATPYRALPRQTNTEIMRVLGEIQQTQQLLLE